MFADETGYPVLRFKGFTKKWEQRKLEDLGEILTGSTPSTKHTEYYSKNGIPWVTPTDIKRNITFSTPRKLSALGESVGRIVPKNTLLITCIASIGKNTILGTKGSFNQQINGLIPRFDKYDLYFLFTQSNLWSQKMKHKAATGTMQIVNKKDFTNLNTLVPILSEQRHIGNMFEQLDHLITLHQHKIDNLKRLKRALLQKMFV
ncbi:restriction endonuclease subunit S [uncultured Limosilactobacillus sp.]|uniref:restriction endonuclease subunit S n=1 Tax=uncultured Limosilactobacillus sp. TaxID=2837629 RepID=UPI0025D7776B|nr:restriction endonuclease subunit S [uncultured Limosilactobacillus sp.]